MFCTEKSIFILSFCATNIIFLFGDSKAHTLELLRFNTTNVTESVSEIQKNNNYKVSIVLGFGLNEK